MPLILSVITLTIGGLVILIFPYSLYWIYKDVKKYKEAGVKIMHPILWTFLSFMFWVPTFPFYIVLKNINYKKQLSNVSFKLSALARILSFIIVVALSVIIVFLLTLIEKPISLPQSQIQQSISQSVGQSSLNQQIINQVNTSVINIFKDNKYGFEVAIPQGYSQMGAPKNINTFKSNTNKFSNFSFSVITKFDKSELSKMSIFGKTADDLTIYSGISFPPHIYSYVISKDDFLIKFDFLSVDMLTTINILDSVKFH